MRHLSGLFLFLFGITVAGHTEEPAIEERLKALETQVRDLAKENAELKHVLGWKETKVPVLVQPAGSETKLSIGGLLQAQAEFGRAADARWAGTNDRLFFRRARIYVTGIIATDFDFKAELDLSGNSLSAATGLLARGNEIFIGWRKYDFANVRFGQIKSAFGAEQLAGDAKLFAIERSLSNDRLTDSRQLGLTLGGELPGKKISYLFMLANGNGVNVSANDNRKFQKSAHVFYTPLDTKDTKLVFGTGGLWSEDAGVAKTGFGFAGNLFTGKRSAWGLDAQFRHGLFDLSAEWLQNTFEPANALPLAKFSAQGWQVTGAYYVIPSRLQALLRCEAFDPNRATAGDASHSWTAGLNFLIKGEDLRLMVDYVYGEVPGSTTDGGRLLTRMQVIF